MRGRTFTEGQGLDYHPRRVSITPFTKELAPMFVDRLRDIAKQYPKKTVCTWINVKGEHEASFTLEDVWRHSGVIAHHLRCVLKLKKGDRVVLCYPFSLEFFFAFIGCLRAGVVAVPVYPPDPASMKKGIIKLSYILQSCGAKYALTDTTYKRITFQLSSLKLEWFATNSASFLKAINSFDEPTIHRFDLAFLQYTSGSTGNPKGVMITHGNLSENVKLCECVTESDVNTSAVFWLPQYHDMGLLAAMTSIAVGAAGYFMSPVTFIRDPMLWVVLLSKVRGQVTSAPNFGYQLLIDKFNPKRLPPDFNLASWRYAGNGAEPIRRSTLEAFNCLYGPYGFNPSAWVPKYGLAENVVYVCHDQGLHFSPKNPEDVSCGSNFLLDVKIVDPATRKQCTEGVEGEIWVSCTSKPLGYWDKPELSAETFHAHLAEDDGKSDAVEYTRTGDLAYILEGRLYFASRIKDMIIIRGENYYPQDIELSTQQTSPVIRPGCVAAFAVVERGQERLCIVCEVRPEKQPKDQVAWDSLAQKIAQNVLVDNGIAASEIVFIPAKTIPKTTSGKIQRRLTRETLERKELRILYRAYPSTSTASPRGIRPTIAPAAESASHLQAENKEGGDSKTVDDTVENPDLSKMTPSARVEYLISCLGITDMSMTLSEMGLDSVKSVQLQQGLLEHCGLDIPLTELFSLTGQQLKDRADGKGKADDEVRPPTMSLPPLESGEEEDPLPSFIVFWLELLGIFYIVAIAVVSALPAYHFAKWSFDLPEPWGYIDLHYRPHLLPAQLYGILSVCIIPLYVLSFSIAVILQKWLIIGRYKERRTRIHSLYYMRWWLVDRFVGVWETAVGGYLLDTPLLNFFYRVMGSRVHWSVSLNQFYRQFDLVSIGPLSSISANLQSYQYDVDYLNFRPIAIGSRVRLESQTVVEFGTEIEDSVRVRILGTVSEGAMLAAGTSWHGNPLRQMSYTTVAQDNSQSDHVDQRAKGEQENRDAGTYRYLFLLGSLKALTLGLVVQISNGLSTPVVLLISSVDWNFDFRYITLWLFLLRVFGTLIIICIFTVLLKWVLVGKARPGVYQVSLFTDYRTFLLDLFQQISVSNVIDIFSPFPAFNWWMWLMGAKVSSSVRIISNYYVHIGDADLLEIGDGTFISNAFFKPDLPSVHTGFREKRPIRIGQFCQIGLIAVIEGDVSLGDFSIVAARTLVPRGMDLVERTTIAGAPPVAYIASAKTLQNLSLFGNSRHRKLKDWALWLISLVCDAISVIALFSPLLPAYELGRWLFDLIDDGDIYVLSWAAYVLVFLFASQLMRIILKWLVIFKYEPKSVTFRSLWLQRYRLYTSYQCTFLTFFNTFVSGTILQNWILRTLGAKIGSRVIIHESLVKEEDQICLENHVILDRSYALGHAFENYQLLIGPVAVETGAVIRARSQLLAPCVVPSYAVLGSGSKIFPGQVIGEGEFWMGSPIQRLQRIAQPNYMHRHSSVLIPAGHNIYDIVEDSEQMSGSPRRSSAANSPRSPSTSTPIQPSPSMVPASSTRHSGRGSISSSSTQQVLLEPLKLGYTAQAYQVLNEAMQPEPPRSLNQSFEPLQLEQLKRGEASVSDSQTLSLLSPAPCK